MPRLPHFPLLMVALATLSGCGVSETERQALAAENAALKKQVRELNRQVDELKNGAERLVAQIRKASETGNYAGARALIKQLATAHPEAPQNAEFVALIPKLDAAEIVAKEKAAAEERERERIANLHNTGIWRVRHYVDDFRNPTSKRYITNQDRIVGKFNNSVTEGAPLRVEFLINSPTEIAIQLYEYDRAPPLKRIGRAERFTIGMQDSEGVKYYYNGTLYSDRIHIEDLDTSGDTIPSVFSKGGVVKFRIADEDNRSQYFFEFNPRFFDNAIRLLSEPEDQK